MMARLKRFLLCFLILTALPLAGCIAPQNPFDPFGIDNLITLLKLMILGIGLLILFILILLIYFAFGRMRI